MNNFSERLNKIFNFSMGTKDVLKFINSISSNKFVRFRINSNDDNDGKLMSLDAHGAMQVLYIDNSKKSSPRLADGLRINITRVHDEYPGDFSVKYNDFKSLVNDYSNVNGKNSIKVILFRETYAPKGQSNLPWNFILQDTYEETDKFIILDLIYNENNVAVR